MGVEIEHKYLVVDDIYKAMAESSARIVQGYICRGDGATVRVRVAGGRARLTVKGRTSGDTRSEYEYDIPVDDAMEMLRDLCHKPVIEKTRHIVRYGGHKWEVDEFGGALSGLVIAEIELPSSDCPYERPPFVGKNVTGDPRYYNSNLDSQIPAEPIGG